MEGLNQWGQRVRDKEQSVMQMFLQQAGQGVLPEDAFSEGNPAWGHVQKQFGGLAPGIQQMNKQAAEMKKMQLDEAKGKLETRVFQRQMQALERFDKTFDSAVKLRKAGDAKFADILFKNASEFYKQVTGIEVDLGAHMNEKQLGSAIQEAELARLGKMFESAKAGNASVIPTLKLASESFKEKFGIDFSTEVQKAADAAMKPQKEPKELSPRDQAFQRLTPAEQRQALLGRDQDPERVAQVTEARDVAKTKATMKGPLFRATVQRDVAARDKAAWDTADKAERNRMMKEEANVRVLNTYPDAQFGEMNGKMGWFVGPDDNKEMVVYWNE